ncbi:Oidioi.mRNA.OKI2018_I69.XSR.g14090.t1.cds [Oikopleura dioica]|uniref:Oidioi.mRNA.OKI2018_I69.XSR.g14090.t1.cds n=1 Tax=Oikopleura dioica TaxID=34765 RepID=A0ABN7SDN0_OIKDI|nr:Oidioi.mRNA.OKI2018_I69.XSR.g14090.t1.cds [Oikopleura dioica]
MPGLPTVVTITDTSSGSGPIPFWLVIVTRLFAILGLSSLVWISIFYVTAGGLTTLLGLLMFIFGVYHFCMECSFFCVCGIRERIPLPAPISTFLDSVESHRPSYFYRAVLYFLTPVSLAIASKNVTWYVFFNCGSLIFSSLLYGYCVFLIKRNGSSNWITAQPPTSLKN